MNQQSDQELHSELRKKIVQSKLKAGGSNIQENSTRRVAAGSSTVSVNKGEGSDSGLQSLGKEIRDVVDRMVESPISEPAKENYPGNLASEELSRGSDVAYGEEVVNLRIMVWWPMDETFYTGTVESFDPLTKKHKIIYDDDDEEVLDLREERWEPFNKEARQIQSSQNEEAEDPSPPKEPANNRNEKKVSKRKIGSSKKQLAPTSSKRSKSEGIGLIKCGASAPSPRQLEKERDEDDDEMDEPIFSFKYGKSRIGKKAVNSLKKKMEP